MARVCRGYCSLSALSNTNTRFAKMPSMPMCCRSSPAEDLKDLGIAAVGHRRKLLEAIAALRAAAADIDTTVPRIRRPIAADAERRPGNLD
jgi:SAM domain (Sterile alpha motif)